MDDAALTSRYASELAEAVSLRPQLLRFVHSELRVRFDAEDIVQETYVRLYNYQTTRQVANVPAFCFATARNLIRDHFQRIRKSSLEETLPEALACPMPLIDEVLDYRERVEVLVRALRSMHQAMSMSWAIPTRAAARADTTSTLPNTTASERCSGSDQTAAPVTKSRPKLRSARTAACWRYPATH